MVRFPWHSCILLSVFCKVALTGSLDRCPSIFNRLGEYKTADGETCYAFVDTEKTWVDARQHCWGWGGELIMIKDQNKMNFVIHTLNSVLRWRNNGVWIGAHDRRGRGWEWTNGERLSWGYWAPGQPSKTAGFISIEDCALMRRGDGWRWHDYHCDSSLFYTYKFICQFRKLPPTTTTSTSTTTTSTTTTTTSTTTTTPIPSTTATTSTRLSTTFPTTHKMIEPDLKNIMFEKYGIVTDKLKQAEGSASSVVGGESGADNSSKDTGILAGIIVGGAILILILAVGTLLLRRRRQKKFEEPSVHFQNLAYARVSQSGQDGNAASNVYMDTNEMNRLYEEVNKQVNHGVNCFSGTVLDIPLPRDSEQNQGDVCCGAEGDLKSDLKKMNNATHVAIPPDTKNPTEVVENQYVDMSTGTNKAKETNLLKEASRMVDPTKPSNLGVDREPMPLPVYANSTENLSEETRELSSTLSTQSKDSTYMNSLERFLVDDEGYMSPQVTLQLNSESDTELMGAEKDPLYDEIR